MPEATIVDFPCSVCGRVVGYEELYPPGVPRASGRGGEHPRRKLDRHWHYISDGDRGGDGELTPDRFEQQLRARSGEHPASFLKLYCKRCQLVCCFDHWKVEYSDVPPVSMGILPARARARHRHGLAASLGSGGHLKERRRTWIGHHLSLSIGHPHASIRSILATAPRRCHLLRAPRSSRRALGLCRMLTGSGSTSQLVCVSTTVSIGRTSGRRPVRRGKRGSAGPVGVVAACPRRLNAWRRGPSPVPTSCSRRRRGAARPLADQSSIHAGAI